MKHLLEGSRNSVRHVTNLFAVSISDKYSLRRRALHVLQIALWSNQKTETRTRNPKPENRNPKPETRNLKLETRNPKLET